MGDGFRDAFVCCARIAGCAAIMMDFHTLGATEVDDNGATAEQKWALVCVDRFNDCSINSISGLCKRHNDDRMIASNNDRNGYGTLWFVR